MAKKFVDMNGEEAQVVFAEAFEKALKDYGVAKEGGNMNIDPSSVGGGGSGGGSGGANTGVNITPPSDGDSNLGNSARNNLNLLNVGLKAGAKSIEIYDKTLQASKANFEPLLREMNELQKVYGNIKLDPNEAVGAARDVSKRLANIRSFYYHEAGETMSKSLGFQGNMIRKYFRDEGEAFQISEDILSSLVEQHSQFIATIDEETQFKLPAYTKALGISTRDVAELVEIQINRTGEANTKVLDEVAIFANGLSKATNIPMKSISANAVRIIKDTERWGDTTAEEATRISATLGQLGQTYDSFTTLTDKFQEFGSAAETSGLISQITGGAVNLDAQHLMYLASEEQEKFLPELRRSLLAGGFDAEAYARLSQAEQRQMAQAFSLDREKMISLIDTRRPSDDLDLLAELDKAKSSGLTAAEAMESGMELAAKATQTTSDIMEEHRVGVLLKSEKALLSLAQGYSDLNEAMKSVNYDGVDKVIKANNAGFEAQGKVVKSAAKNMPKNATFEEAEEFLGQVGKDAYDAAKEAKDKFLNDQNPPTAQSNNNNQNQITPQNVAQTNTTPTPSPTPTPTPVNSQNNNPDPNMFATPPVNQNQTLAVPSTNTFNQNQIQQMSNVQLPIINNQGQIMQSHELTNQSIGQLTTAVNSLVSSNNNFNRPLILQVDGQTLGQIVIDSRIIQGGETVSVVTTNNP